ncbi:hypothetical protein Ciccas_008938 [Cichlidogyrus casuarinus]|uniref:Uncharacterized protein n=1 Tax=Cichlidogyrus casuarinus TaxID=1844966 RepID=A0ABD2PYP3_9PLAT
MTGGRHLEVHWRSDSIYDARLQSNNSKKTEELMTQFNQQLGQDVTMTGFSTVDSRLHIERQSAQDVYVCEGLQRGETQSTKINVIWPPRREPEPSNQFRPESTPPAETNQQGVYERKYSLAELLGAVCGTVLAATMLFLIIGRVCFKSKRFACCQGKRSTVRGEKGDMSKHYLGTTTTGVTHSPNGTNSSNTSYGGANTLLLDQQKQAAVINSLFAQPNLYQGAGLIYQNAGNDSQVHFAPDRSGAKFKSSA